MAAWNSVPSGTVGPAGLGCISPPLCALKAWPSGQCPGPHVPGAAPSSCPQPVSWFLEHQVPSPSLPMGRDLRTRKEEGKERLGLLFVAATTKVPIDNSKRRGQPVARLVPGGSVGTAEWPLGPARPQLGGAERSGLSACTGLVSGGGYQLPLAQCGLPLSLLARPAVGHVAVPIGVNRHLIVPCLW